MKCCRNPIQNLVAFALVVLAGSCQSPIPIQTPTTSPSPGSLQGKVIYGDEGQSSGVLISIEKTDGLRTLSATRSAETRALTRSLDGSTITDKSGSYAFPSLVPGTYTVYASTPASKEKAVTTNVLVESGRTASASDLKLTAIGNVSGTVQIDSAKTGNWGFLVFIAGTSYMAMTDDGGTFTITDIPISTGYTVLISKGDFLVKWGNVDVVIGTTVSLGTKVVSKSDLTTPTASIVWKGSLETAPTNPSTNWAYYNSTDKKSYIWDGSGWQILAQDGATGATGATGTTGPVGATGTGITWKGSLALAPITPQSGWAYYNTSSLKSYIWDGSAWQVLAQDGAVGAVGATGAVGANGISVTWMGSAVSAPTSPQLNWAYYNSTDKKSYIWDGSAWQILAQDGATGATGAVGASGTGIVWKGSLASAPTSPQTGWAYYNTMALKSYIWDGSAWQILAQDGSGGATGATGAVGANGVSVTWKGSFATAPTSPQLNWAYYNSTDKKSYIWDGSAWQILAQDGATGATGDTGATGAVGASGTGIVWKGSIASAPTTPQTGWAYYNTTALKSYIWDGSAWQILAQDGSDGATGATGAVGANGVGVTWKGSFATAPTSPQLNWAYYNSTDKKSYIWDGSAWQILAQDGVPGAPSAPTGLTVVSGISQVSASWSAVSGASSYNLYYSNSSTVTISTGTKIADISNTSKVVAGLANGTTWYFIVTAVNAGGESSGSSTVYSVLSPQLAQWARTPTFASSPSASEYNGVTTDSSGNVYAVGKITGGTSYNFGNGVTVTGHVNGLWNAVIVKFNSSGIAQWARSTTSHNNITTSWFDAVAINSLGQVITVGYVSKPDVLGFGGGVTATSNEYTSCLIVSYSSEGVPLWANSVGSTTGTTYFSSVACDSNGNTYAAGYIGGNQLTSLGNSVSVAGSTPGDNPLVVKYNSSGLAVSAFSPTAVTTTASCYVKGIVLDQLSNIFLAGSSSGTGLIDWGNGITSLGSSSDENSFIVKLSTAGVAQWALTAASGSDSSGFSALARDESGNLYAAGQFGPHVNFGSAIVANSTAGGPKGFGLLKVNSSGVPLWVVSDPTTPGSGFTGVGTDSSGNVYVSGWVSAGKSTFGNGILGSSAGINSICAKFSNLGSAKWVQSSTPYNPIGYGIAVDTNANVFEVGSFAYITADFGNSVTAAPGYTAGSGSNAFLVKYAGY